MGDVEKNIIKQARRFNEELPLRIKNKPVLHNGLDLYLQAFFELDTERNSGMNIAPIPASAVRLYNQSYDITGEMAEDMLEFIRVLDNAFIKLVSAKG